MARLSRCLDTEQPLTARVRKCHTGIAVPGGRAGAQSGERGRAVQAIEVWIGGEQPVQDEPVVQAAIEFLQRAVGVPQPSKIGRQVVAAFRVRPVCDCLLGQSAALLASPFQQRAIGLRKGA